MEPYARHERIADLEQALPALTGGERARSLAELSWHLRERDTRRAQAMARDAASLLAGCEGGEAVAARLELTRGACALLFREVDAALGHARRGLELLGEVGDASGRADAHLLLSQLARTQGDDRGARDEAIAAQRAAAEAQDPVRKALAAVALGSVAGADPVEASACAGAAPAACRLQYLNARTLVARGDIEGAMRALSEAAADAPLHGMDELALESELAIARLLAGLGDLDIALDLAARVVTECRERGWRALLASAAAGTAEWLLRRGEGARAMELLREARAAMPPGDASLESIHAQAQLATGGAAQAAETFARAAQAARGHDDAAGAAGHFILEARALARCGEGDRACERAMLALRLARQAGSRSAEMHALDALGTLHAEHPSPDRTSRSAIAFLRHAAEIAEELDDVEQRAGILRQIARIHEAHGDLASALGAQHAAQAAAERQGARRAHQLELASRLRWVRERVAIERAHAEQARTTQARHAEELRGAHAAVERTRALAQRIIEAPDAASIVEALEQGLAGVADVHLVGLFVFDASGARLSRYAREAGRPIAVRDVASADLESYVARAAREQRELHVQLESARVTEAAVTGDSASAWFAPVMSGAEVLGVLTLQSRLPHAYGESEKIVFRALAGHAAVALAKSRLREALQAQRELRIDMEERLRRLATMDPLTGLATRAHFFAIARERLERARRDGGPCGLVIADIDAFKGINDIHGQAAGDRVLSAVAALLARQLQPDDAAGRIGAEEFALFLPGATLEATVAAAERIRLAIEAHPVMHDGRPVVVTLSFGCTAIANVATDIPDKPVGATVERLVREADGALYEAQGSGGNRVIAWPAYQALHALRSGEPLAHDRQSFA